MTHCNKAALETQLIRLVADHQLPSTYIDNSLEFYPPVIDWLLAELDRKKGSAYLLGIYGAQGTGKTTLAELLTRYLRHEQGDAVVNLSIDDFYYSRAERLRLATEVNPLLQTRGPPGTHDIELALDTVRRATSLSPAETINLPRFDKATDDRAPASAWPTVVGPVDIVILEGWCIGCAPVTPETLEEPINALERDEDSDGSWRRFVNESMKLYQPLFALLDGLLMLKAPSFEAIFDWRHEQERKLRQSVSSANNRVMTQSELIRFMQFFERVSRNNEEHVLNSADVICRLGDDHQIQSLDFR